MKKIISILLITIIAAAFAQVATAKGPYGHVWRDMDRVPTATDDRASGYREGDSWIVEATDEVYLCGDDSIGAAVWTKGGGDVAGDLNVGGILGTSGVSTLRIDMTPQTISSDTTLSAGGMYLVDTSGGDVHIKIGMPTAPGGVSEFSFLRDGICGVSVFVNAGYSIDMPGASGTTVANSLLTETGSRFNALATGDSVFFCGTGTISLW